jgi:hypothetical protein
MLPAAAQTSPAPVPAVPLGPATGPVADLRFGMVPTPAVRPGFDPVADAKALIVAGTPSPASAPIPGRQIAGGRGDARWLVRVPDAWNGNLVVAGTPAFRSEYANDAIWGDYLLARGYAFATSNKGIPYNAVAEPIAATPAPDRIYPIPFDLAQLETKKLGYRLGALVPAKVGIASWNDDFAALTLFAKGVLAHAPARSYAVGLSNGGAQVRSLLERHPDLVDGGVDWSGVFWSPQRSLLDYLPPFLRAMPAYVASAFTDQTAAGSIANAGFPDDRRQADPHPSLWFEYYAGQPSFYADLTLFAYALLIDPDAVSVLAGDGCTPSEQNPVRLPGTCRGSGLRSPSARAAYVPSARARDAIRAFAHGGAIGKPLVSVAGDADVFVTPQNNAKPYLDAVVAQGRGANHWQYLVKGGTHVDAFVPLGYGLQPQLPFAWAAFEQLVGIVERGARPAGAGTQRTVTMPAEIGGS